MNRIRSLTPDDKTWWLMVWKDCERWLGKDPGSIWYRWQTARNAREHMVGIEGQAFAHYLQKLDGVTTLYEIGVALSARRQGLARLLLEYMGTPLILKTDADNLESNPFYLALGFTLEGQTIAKNGKLMNHYAKW